MSRDVRSELEVLQAMQPQDRKVYLLTSKVNSEQYWLQDMLRGWKESREYTMQDIRTQRKGVQRWQKRLNEAKAKLRRSE